MSRQTDWRCWLILVVMGTLDIPLPAAEPAPPVRPARWEDHVTLAAKFQKSLDTETAYFTRYLSAHAVRGGLPTFRRLQAWWINQLSFAQTPTIPREVSGSDGTLFVIDIRDYNWNSPAFQAVAERDPLFAEYGDPPISYIHEDAEFLRQSIGVYPSEKVLKQHKVPIEAIVWGPWFFRETIESDRSTSYFDLLFAEKRFVEFKEESDAGTRKEIDDWRQREWPGGEYIFRDDSGRKPLTIERGRKFYVELKFKTRVVGKSRFKFVDFPATEDDWNRQFGVDVAQKFDKDNRLNNDFGAIVEGGRDKPPGFGNGSAVSVANRLLLFTRTNIGTHYKTFDVKETTGLADFSEQLIFQGGKFYRGDAVVVFSQAGELIGPLPNGGSAYFLINDQRKRLDVADGHFANDRADERNNSGVRNAGSCVICHAPSNGMIPPDNWYKKYLDAGGEILYKDKDQQNRANGFFLGWESVTDSQTKAYASLLDRTTKDQPPDPEDFRKAAKAQDAEKLKQLMVLADKAKQSKGWTGAQLAKEFLTQRNYWDNPVTPAIGASYLGVTEQEFKQLCFQVPEEFEKQHKVRVSELRRGLSVPSRTFEIDILPQLAFTLAKQRKGQP